MTGICIMCLYEVREEFLSEVLSADTVEDRMRTSSILNEVERDVFDLIVHEALDSDEISERLALPHRTVDLHVRRILRKFSVKRRDQLIVLFWRTSGRERYLESKRERERARKWATPLPDSIEVE